MKSRSAGSITVYLCLILLCILSLVYAGYRSARQAAGRVVLSSSAEQGLYSLFANYDRTLFQEFGILGLDGSYGSGEFYAGSLLNEFTEYAEYITDPKKGLPGIGSDVIGARLSRGEAAVLGYTLLTDQNGTAFARQCSEQMKEQLGAAVLQTLQNRLGQEQNTAAQQKNTTAETSVAEITEDEMITFDENPLDEIKVLKRKGLLSLVMPPSKTVSAGSVQVGTLVSNRALESGIGMEPTAWSGSGQKLLLLEYLMQEFPCFTSEADSTRSGPLKYQAEYAIGGKYSDEENLKWVVRKLIILREASNLQYLMTDPMKSKEADAAAAGICAVFLAPELIPVVSAAVKAAWAFGESLLDIRVLLEGGKIALVKSNSSWQLSIQNLGRILTAMDTERHGSQDGITYEEYLRLLLLSKTEKSLTYSLMDLTESNIRSKAGYESFRLDHCLDAIEVELSGTVGTKRYTLQRSYGYEMREN